MKKIMIRKTMRQLSCCWKKNNGFTLIEIVVVIAIVAIVFGIAANGFNRMNSGSNIKLQVETMVSDIRSAALSALSAEQFQLATTTAWGAYISGTNGEYTIFADLNGDETYQTNEKYKTVKLRTPLTMYLSWQSAGQTDGTLIFLNVTAAPHYNTAAFAVADELGVILTDPVTNIVKTVTINSAGTVSHD